MFTYVHIYQEYHIRNNSPYQFFSKLQAKVRFMSCIKTQNYSFLTVTTFSQMFNTLSLYDEVMTGRPLVSVLYNITTFQNVVLTLVRRSDGVNETRRIKLRV